MFIEALFVIALVRNNPTVLQWLNEVWYIRNIGYYPQRERSELLIHARSRKDLKGIMRSLKSQDPKVVHCMILLL